eukprot:scaffold741_cov303-Prasinococcus_capsulatus_cf.AAC.5
MRSCVREPPPPGRQTIRPRRKAQDGSTEDVRAPLPPRPRAGAAWPWRRRHASPTPAGRSAPRRRRLPARRPRPPPGTRTCPRADTSR